METLNDTIKAIKDLRNEDVIIKQNMDIFFVLALGTMVYLMQAGFGFFEAGSVRSRNTTNILIKNLLDSFVSALAYYTLGYAFAYGEGNEFIGWHKFAFDGMANQELATFYFQYVFVAATVTIVSGSLAERCELTAYFVYSFFLSAFIYPVATHWSWTSQGWLAVGADYTIDNKTVNIHYTDFSGSGIVHLLGGVAAFVGAAILGPRRGRFHQESGAPIPIRGHSVPFAALGGFILLFGFFAFNIGANGSISNEADGATVPLSLINTAISGSAAAFVNLAIYRFGILGTQWSLLKTMSGALGGMVAMCAGANVIRPWGALIVGAIAAVSVSVTSWGMVKLRVDDPVDAVAVHGGAGIWGVISVAFLHPDKGIFFKGGKESAILLGWQIGGLLAIIAWTGGLCLIMFGALRLLGVFRISEEMELKGMDIPKHGEPAYPLEAYGHGYLENITILNDGGDVVDRKQGFVCETLGDDGNYESGERKRINQENALIYDPVKGHKMEKPVPFE